MENPRKPLSAPDPDRAAKLQAFDRLLTVMDELRENCPWDRKQTMESLRHLTIEETYELSDAILKGDRTEIRKELGDILLHMVFYARIGREEGAFDIASVLNGICDKLIERHPHVYGDVKADDEETVKANWEKIKLKTGNKSVLAGVPVGIKDIIATAGIRTTYGSALYAEHVPAQDAPIVRRLKAAGAIVIGKTNTPEFAAGANTYNAVFGATHTPGSVPMAGRTDAWILSQMAAQHGFPHGSDDRARFHDAYVTLLADELAQPVCTSRVLEIGRAHV